MDNGNFWEFYKEEERKQSTAPIRHPTAEKVRRIVSRVLGWGLLVIFVFYVTASIFIHPIDRLKLSLFLSGGNYTISLSGEFRYYEGPNHFLSSVSQRHLGEIKVDRNLMCVTDNYGDDTYYLMDGEKVYMYTKDDNGKWNRTESNKTFPVVGTSLGDVLLDRKSYERGELFRYKTKSGVDTGTYDVVYVQQWGLQYELEGQTENATITMSFGRFGTTRITPPWEQ